MLILYFHLNYLILFLPFFSLKFRVFESVVYVPSLGSVWWPKKSRKTKGSGLCILKNPHSTERNGTTVFGRVVQETRERERSTHTQKIRLKTLISVIFLHFSATKWKFWLIPSFLDEMFMYFP